MGSGTRGRVPGHFSAGRPITGGLFTPILRRTIAVPSPYQGRFMFGFRLKAKSEHEATDIPGWYGAGAAQVRWRWGWWGDLPMRNAGADRRTISASFSAPAGVSKIGRKNCAPFSPVPPIFSARFLLLVIVLPILRYNGRASPFIRTIFVPSCRAGGVWG